MAAVGLNFFNNNSNDYSSYSKTQAPKQDQDAYAQQYATQNGISLEEAKIQLKEKFGDPQEGTQLPGIDQTSIFSYQGANTTSATNTTNNLFASMLDIFSNTSNQNTGMRGNPDVDAQKYADRNGISLEEAKEELKAQYGEPPQMDFSA